MAEEKEILFKIKADTSEANENVNQLKDNIDDIDKKSTGDQKFASLARQIRLAKVSAQELGEKFGENSIEFQKAIQLVAKLEDDLGAFDAKVKLLNPDVKFKVLTTTLRAGATAFQGVTGAMQFFGAESENVERQIAKLQGLMAFNDAINQIEELKDDFKNLGIIQKTTAAATTVTSVVMKGLGIAAETTSVGFKVLRGAIIATGIGALVVGLTMLITNFQKIKEVVLNTIPGLKGVADTIGNIVNRVTDFLGLTSEAGRKQQKVIEDLEGQVKKNQEFLDANGHKYDEYTKRKIQADIDYKNKKLEILKDDTKSVAKQNTLIKQYEDKRTAEIKQADNDRSNATKKANEEAAKNRQKANEEAIKLQQDYNKDLKELLNQNKLDAINNEYEKARETAKINYDNQIEQINQTKYSEEKKNNLRKQLAISYNNQIKKINADEKQQQQADLADWLQSLTDTANRLRTEAADKKVTVAETRLIETEISNEVNPNDTPEQAIEKINNLAAATLEAENAAFEAKLESLKGQNEKIALAKAEHNKKVIDIEKEKTDAVKRLSDAETEAKLNNLQTVSQAISSITTLIGQETVAGKALAVAQATIDTYVGATKALAQGGIFGTVAAVGIIAAGLANVKKIISVKVPNKSGDNSAASAPAITTQPIAPIINAAQANNETQNVRVTNQDQAPVRAYIVNSDLQTNQQRTNFLNNVSTI